MEFRVLIRIEPNQMPPEVPAMQRMGCSGTVINTFWLGLNSGSPIQRPVSCNNFCNWSGTREALAYTIAGIAEPCSICWLGPHAQRIIFG